MGYKGSVYIIIVKFTVIFVGKIFMVFVVELEHEYFDPRNYPLYILVRYCHMHLSACELDLCMV